MKTVYLLVSVVVILGLGLAMLPVPSVNAQGIWPKVIPPDWVAYGRTYSEWSVAWEQWADSIPVANHPLFDNGDCSVGQSGPVWFLGGKFCASGATNCGTSNVVRSCNVPAGKALYVAVLNAENSALELNDPKVQIQDLRSMNAAAMDGAANLSLAIDGVPIPHLQDRFRVQSTVFGFTIPDDNLFTAIGEGNFAGGAYFPAADDGVYAMIAPLPAGPHKIHFHGAFPVYNFTLDITYKVLVAK
jgi:hypothetical protein